ncbi:MucR family transcriptional regulator [Acetobacter sacchari]|uniref:MucR family transcriptional regulator n=1 Tax=Acetobacter sacchari TaxID=2661687 RepID=A0ABS3LZV9_9PROT|nr:MucR family transcriptional regulator [Acetobacter sacchari]MBO1361439.1 MucR family transcriptional regulator [Acetobacter sacchari]
MPHKSRAERVAYLEAYRAKHRPSPETQERNGLPPFGAYEYSADGTKIRCHACGRLFGALNTHVRVHDLDAETYKEVFGLKRTSSLLSPAAAEKQRQAAIERDQGRSWREGPSPISPRPIGITNRLQTSVEASAPRKGRNMRAGQKAKPDATNP